MFPHSCVKEEDGTEANETNDEAAFQASRGSPVRIDTDDGGHDVQLSMGETADHSVPKQDRDVLKEASSAAISFTIEDMELLA